MGKALKIFLVLNFLLSIVVVGFGVKIFMDREVIKARTVLLQNNAQEVARRLQWGVDVAWDSADARPGQFNVPQPVDKEGIPALQSRLRELADFAAERVVVLEGHYEDLLRTRTTLAQTQDTLRSTENTLARTQRTLEETQQTLSRTQNDLQQANRTITSLEADKNALTSQVNTLNNEVTALNNEITGLNTRIEALTIERDGAMAENRRLRGILEGGRPDTIHRGRTAEILTVNNSWLYAVIDRGEVDQIPLFLEAMIHRDDEFIGRAVVSRVEETVAIIEIEPGSLAPGVTVQAGDSVFFN